MFAMFISYFVRFAVACTPGTGGGFLGFPTWYQYLDSETVAGKCTPKFDITNPSQVGAILLAIVEIMLRIGVLVAIGFVIYGGFRYIMSQGEPDKTTSARHTILNALIGLGIATLATVIVSFVAGSLV